MKIWTRPQPLLDSQGNGYHGRTIAKRLGISPVISDILWQRGLKEEEIIEFLRPSLLDCPSPFDFKDMAKAVERLVEARQKGEKVLIYGDYDVDGVTSTALLFKVLRDLGIQAITYIPNRMDEGYGLHKEAISKAHQAQVKVIITVDCGITAVEEVDYAKTLGIDIILTDHHEPPEVIPQAMAILNPKMADSGYPFRELAGVGVALKLAQALIETQESEEENPHTLLEIIDLAALGTIADLVPLVGENRVIVAHGLKRMEKTIHLGLATLLEECGLANKPLTARQIAFMVAPRINAAGRMDSPRAGLELLITGDEARAKELARLLSKENTQRQATEKEILAEAIDMLEQEPLPRVIVLSAENWHHGVIGIVASRLVERYYRPVFLIAEEEDIGKGSARGIAGYHVLNELRSHEELMENLGGHSQAAGFSLKKDKISILREALNKSAEKYPESLYYEPVRIEKCISLEELNSDLMEEIEYLAPFGFGNPNPVFAGIKYPLFQADTVGKDQDHLKCYFGNYGEWEGIAFRKGEKLEKIINSSTVDVAFNLSWNNYQGNQHIQLGIRDITSSATWQEDLLLDNEAHREITQGQREVAATQEKFLEVIDWRSKSGEEWRKALQPFGENIRHWDCTRAYPQEVSQEESQEESQEKSQENEKLALISGIPTSLEELKDKLYEWQKIGIQKVFLVEPQGNEDVLRERVRFLSRDDLVQIYRVLYDRAIKNNPFPWDGSGFPKWKAKRSLEIFEELGLLKFLGRKNNSFLLQWFPADQKLDLESSLRFRSGRIRWEELKKFQAEYKFKPWEELEKSILSIHNVG
ncbi:MAG: single-stranded-DNA-specific exonuclease RecJ [Desulfitobacterium sp.]|nr:single-stranded-DNA-specific exonuclease RecJ [Desulfitobacterium sp.]